MFIEIDNGLIINSNNIGAIDVSWEYCSATNSRYGVYYIYIQGTRFNITKNDYNKLKNILVHGVVDVKLNRWQKMKISFVGWLKSLRLIKSLSQD